MDEWTQIITEYNCENRSVEVFCINIIIIYIRMFVFIQSQPTVCGYVVLQSEVVTLSSYF